jgi:hypothetical protein
MPPEGILPELMELPALIAAEDPPPLPKLLVWSTYAPVPSFGAVYAS